jgi:hypothetical protein
VVRALSFYGPGELRALRVEDPKVFPLVSSMMRARCDGGAPTSQMAQALGYLCAVELTTHYDVDGRLLGLDEAYKLAERNMVSIIKCCAATITELKGPLPAILCNSSGNSSVLARCSRLEVLTDVYRYKPALWLGLSQLHTLHGVDLSDASVGAIAAALPRLHTLDAYCSNFDPTSVAGFFTDLLPRLRVFRFGGTWPATAADSVAAPTAPRPLPLLEELVWREHSPQPPATVIRNFLGARPIVLRASCAMIVQCVSGRGGAAGEPESCFLERLCELHGFYCAASLAVSDMARVLRAALRLRAFCWSNDLRGDASFLTASGARLVAAFEGLVHPRLRRFEVSAPMSCLECDDGCVSRLRQTFFPRLQELKVNGRTVFITPAES